MSVNNFISPWPVIPKQPEESVFSGVSFAASFWFSLTSCSRAMQFAPNAKICAASWPKSRPFKLFRYTAQNHVPKQHQLIQRQFPTGPLCTRNLFGETSPSPPPGIIREQFKQAVPADLFPPEGTDLSCCTKGSTSAFRPWNRDFFNEGPPPSQPTESSTEKATKLAQTFLFSSATSNPFNPNSVKSFEDLAKPPKQEKPTKTLKPTDIEPPIAKRLRSSGPVDGN